MALGNNLKKKKLIPDGSEAEEKKPAKKQPSKRKKAVKKASTKQVKKAPVASSKKADKPQSASTPKKKQINEPKTSRKTPEKEVKQTITVTKKVINPSIEELPESITNAKLPVYIAKELLEKKKSLRNRYQEEITALRERASIQFVIINIGGESYAMEIDNIKEIVPITDISKTPNTPSHIKGITNVRGRTYVVFDLADKFKVKGDEFPKYLLVLNDRTINSSLTLSILPSTLKVKGSNISSDLHIIEDSLLDASYIKGLIQHEDKLIYYLDIIELIKNEKAIVVPDELLQQIDE